MNLLIIILSALCVALFVLCIYFYQRMSIWRERTKMATTSSDQIRIVARDIIQEQSNMWRSDSERRLSEILQPIRSNLEEFKRSYTESYDRESRDRLSLQTRMKDLIESSLKLGNEAKNLATALRGNTRVQGRWGEMVLENILTRSGLRVGEEFVLQKSTIVSTEESVVGGNRLLRPDAIINYPGDKKLVIDAKTSLTAYFEYLDLIDEGRDEIEINAKIKAHVLSLKNHVATLGSKNYQDYLGSGSAEFVVMFIPHEGAFLAAMHHDAKLWDDAFSSRVIIASPTHLLAIVKLVEQMWSTDRRNKNAIKIASEGAKLIEKLAASFADLEKISAAIDNAKGFYDAAMIKLKGKGGVLSHGKNLEQLGGKLSKKLPEIEE